MIPEVREGWHQLERLGVEVWDPEKLVVVTDHYVPVFDAESRAILDLARDWVKKQECRFHDEEGICHVVLPENGYLKPGCLQSGETVILPQVVPSVATCSVLAPRKWRGCSLLERYGSGFPKRSGLNGKELSRKGSWPRT